MGAWIQRQTLPLEKFGQLGAPPPNSTVAYPPRVLNSVNPRALKI